MTTTHIKNQKVSIGIAILETFGISTKDVCSFKLECRDLNVAMIYVEKCIHSLNGPTYSFESHEITKAEKVEKAS